MRILDFVAAHIGRRLWLPGGEGQCVDLANAWLATLGVARVYRNAVDWQQPIGGMAWTANDPTNVPPPGAVVVWNPGHGIDAAGHVAVCIVADVMHVLSIDQNWADPACQLAIHPYTGVAGWQSHT